MLIAHRANQKIIQGIHMVGIRRQLVWFGLVGMLVLALSAAPEAFSQTPLAQESPTPTPNINWVDQPLGINVRSGPGFKYNVVGALTFGSWVQPLARTLDGNWILINYLYTQGWVQVDGVSWRLNVTALPVKSDPAPTPIPRPLYYNTPGGPTQTPNASWVSVGLEGGFVRSGPGQGYLPIGALFTGDVVDPVAHDQAEDWVLIRFGEGYGWVRYDLVNWTGDIAALAVVDVPELTPSFTPVPIVPTATNTPTSTRTATPTNTPTITPTPSVTSSVTPSMTATLTLTPILTPTHTPTATYSPTATATASPTLTATLTLPPTYTEMPTQIPTNSPSQTPSPLPTEIIPTKTATLVASPEPSATPTTLIPTETATLPPTLTSTITPSLIPSHTPTALPSPTLWPTNTLTPVSDISVGAVGDDSASDTEPNSGVAPSPDTPTTDQTGGPSGLQLLLVGGAVASLLYLGLYLVNAANQNRYWDGFVLSICPICEEGDLSLAERRYRTLGIPRTRRVVRCDVCRSVLRQVGRQRWRYAVDGAENAELYDELNGQILTENDLIDIAPEYRGVPPEYIEE